MLIKSIAETSYRGMYKLAPEDGSAFFIRREYLTNLDFDSLQPGFELNEEQREELLDAGLCSVVELKAVDYLARAEQCRAGLNRKLLQKGYAAQYIDRALTFLESADYLSDSRFARAWLNTRRTNHYEGRTRLLAELMSRGISRDLSAAAVEEFFFENNEDEICRKAFEKLSRKKSGDKLTAAMIQAGFSYKQIRNAEESFPGQACE
ncbi:MAG: RecX family transcriptional regulator [Treponema sp.]|nr:RecX family transcriptional regulator [Treponema sp.]